MNFKHKSSSFSCVGRQGPDPGDTNRKNSSQVFSTRKVPPLAVLEKKSCSLSPTLDSARYRGGSAQRRAHYRSKFCYHPLVKPGGCGILGLGATLVAITLGALSSRAGAAVTPDVVIDCPSLSNEQRASLEARARAELAMNHLTESEIHISCVLPLVVVVHATKDVPIRSSSATLVQDTNQWVEEILTLIHAVIAPPAGTTLNKPVADAPIVTYPPVENTPNSALQQQSSSAALTPLSPKASKRGETSQLIFGGGGLCSEFWAKPVNALMGPCVSLGLRISSFSRFAATGATQWSTAKPNDIALHLWQAGVEARFGRTAWFALGTQLSAVDLTPERNLSPKSKFAYEPTLALRGGFSASLAGQRLVTGAGLRSYAANRDVRVDDKSVFQLPWLALTLGIEYEIDL